MSSNILFYPTNGQKPPKIFNRLKTEKQQILTLEYLEPESIGHFCVKRTETNNQISKELPINCLSVT